MKEEDAKTLLADLMIQKNAVYVDAEMDDTPYEILELYKQERMTQFKDQPPALFIEFLESMLVDRHDCPPPWPMI